MEPTALVVHQDPVMGDRVAYWLETLGVPAMHVLSSHEAVHTLHEAGQPRFVVVSSDLPDMDAFAHLRHEDPVLAQLPLVVVMAERGQAPDPRLEPTYVVGKPPDSAEFIFAVAALRDGMSWAERTLLH
jgi:CheY-like chemotaxis protein